jgi:hypothetical protein
MHVYVVRALLPMMQESWQQGHSGWVVGCKSRVQINLLLSSVTVLPGSLHSANHIILNVRIGKMSTADRFALQCIQLY